MAAWQVARVIFEGVAPAHAGEGATAWEFTARVGERGYSIYLIIQNRILMRHAGLQPGEPPPAELLPRLLAYVQERLEHPMLGDRYPKSLQGATLTVGSKAEWRELVGEE